MKEFTKKICVIGDPAVGKTSLIRRFIEERFDDKYLSTLGIKPSKKSILLEDKILTFMIWDLAGQEEFKVSQNIGYRDSKGAILVVDLTRKETLPLTSSTSISAKDNTLLTFAISILLIY